MRFGHPLIELPETGSTNAEATRLVAEGKAQHGTVVLAHDQTAGLGQRGRTWLSAPGLDLTFSVVCRPANLRADRQFGLSKVAALAVHDAVQELVTADARIKWPNDILVAGRKVAGILIRNELAGERVSTSIVGIGLNVNSTAFPEELAATSLLLETGAPLDRMAVLQRLLDRFGHWWEQWQRAPDEGLPSYSDRLWARGRWADALLDGTPFQARPLDVDELGRLLVEGPNGQVSAYGLDRLRFAPRGTSLQG